MLPFTVPCPVEPASGFQLYDRDLACVETIAGTLQFTDLTPSPFARWLDQLVEVALTGPEAAMFCRQLAAALRRLITGKRLRRPIRAPSKDPR